MRGERGGDEGGTGRGRGGSGEGMREGIRGEGKGKEEGTSRIARCVCPNRLAMHASSVKEGVSFT